MFAYFLALYNRSQVSIVALWVTCSKIGPDAIRSSHMQCIVSTSCTRSHKVTSIKPYHNNNTNNNNNNNQRTNGPVNAHLISGPTVSTKTSKIGQGQTRVIIYINFVELVESPMLHVKFQDHRTSGSGEEYFFKVFTIYGHDCHLGHVTCIIYRIYLSHFLRKLHIQFGQADSQ